MGHVFQDRLKNEAIEDERYLLAVIRYIHNNPVKARIVDKPEDYRWSSYSMFLRKPSSMTGAVEVDIRYILDIFSEDRQAAFTEFIRFSMEEDSSIYLDCEREDIIRTVKQGHEYLEDYLVRRYRGAQWEQLKQDVVIKKEVIRHLRTSTNLSIRTIAELLDVDRNIVQRTRP